MKMKTLKKKYIYIYIYIIFKPTDKNRIKLLIHLIF